VIRSIIARLTDRAARSGKEAKERLGRTFIKVREQGGRWLILLTALPGDGVEYVVLQAVREDSGWVDLRELPNQLSGYAFTGIPPALPFKSTDPITGEQHRALHAKAKDHGFINAHDDLTVLIANLWRLSSTKEINQAQFRELMGTVLPVGYAATVARNFYGR